MKSTTSHLVLAVFLGLPIGCGGSDQSAAPAQTPTSAAAASTEPSAATPATGAPSSTAAVPISSAPSSASTPPSPATPAAGGACGLRQYGPGYDVSCQGALDQACCAEEKACGADADCKKLVACLDACPHGKGKGKETEACAATCTSKGKQTPGLPLLDKLANCSKKMPPSGGKCDWP
jgi:hypothetical protein